MAALFPSTWNSIDSNEEKEMLRQLGSLAPQAAVREISALIASVASANALPVDQRLRFVRELEEAAQRHLVPCSRGYLRSPHRGDEGQAEELQLWRTSREFWAQLATAYNVCVNAYREELKSDALHKLELTRLAVSMLRAYGARMKWDQFRYGPHSGALWQIIGRAYLVCVEEGVDRRLAAGARAGRAQDTTVEQEYLKILMFQASSMDSLLPLEIEIAEHLIGRFLPIFSFSPERAPDHAYWIDPGQRRGPMRLLREPSESETLRYFGPGRALSALTELQEVLEKGEAPADLDLGRAYSARIVLPVVRHLAACWELHPRQREFDRYKVSSRLTVVSGLERIHERLREGADELRNGAEWTVRNISRSGLSVFLPLADHEAAFPIQIGTLLGMRPEGGDSMLVGVVRRFAREFDGQAIGVETLAKRAAPFEIHGGGRSGQALMLDAVEAGHEVRVALPSSGASAMAPFTVEVEGKTAQLMPIELVERGAAFDLARYHVEQVV